MVGQPTRHQISSYERCVTEYRFEGVNPEIVVVIPSFNLESGGKVPSGVCRKAELWVSARLSEIEDGTDTQTPRQVP